MSKTERTEEEAAHWVAREDRGLTAREKGEFACWLDQDVGNRVSYLRMKAIWDRSERLGALRNAPHFAVKSGKHTPLWRSATLLAAAVALVVIGGYFAWDYQHRTAVYAANMRQRPALHLADGTQVQLNVNSQIRTKLTARTREVILDRGEAYFDVVHDAARPFVVIAGNRRISDIGTKFSVRRIGDTVRVLVEQGEVRVDIMGEVAPEAPIYAAGGSVVLAKTTETLVIPHSRREVADELSWRQGFLTFDHVTLADAADEFNRYNQRRLVVLGAARDIRIGGRFRADNIDSFGSLLREALGLTVQDGKDQIVISK